MNCQEALSLLYDIIDKEASEIDTHEVQEHLSRCRHCSEIYRVEKSVNALIKAKLQGNEPAPCIDVLKSRVLGELDSIDEKLHDHIHTPAQPAKKNSSFRIGRYLAIAAAFIVVVGAVYYGTRLSDHERVFAPLERAHWAAADDVDAFRNSSATVNSVTALDREWNYVVDAEVHNFTLVGGRSEQIKGATLTHFVYHNADKIVSVFVGDHNSLSIPDELRDTAVTRNGITFFDHNCPGCRLVYHEDGDVIVVTATTDKDVELLDFVPGHRVI